MVSRQASKLRGRFDAIVKRYGSKRVAAVCAGMALAAFGGAYFIAVSRAATFLVGQEAESGVLATATRVADASASGGAAVRFGPVSDGGGNGNIVNVSTADQLKSALSGAKAGDVITLADGTYSGQFASTASGSVSAPITVTGSRNAIINGGAITSGYTFALGSKNTTTSISYWKLNGFTITGGQKGIVFDNVQHSSIDGVNLHDTGEEGIHLRDFSSNNVIRNSIVTKTGQSDQQYGEGLYVGSAQSNWSTYSQGNPDKSDNNQLINNNISYTGAENIDIKEGTHAGIISGNTLDGHGMCYNTTAGCNSADSLIDMKGEGWTVSNNTGSYVHVVWNDGTQESDGFQVHVISQGAGEGSGNNNTFSGNKLSDIAGYGFSIQSQATGTKVTCDNTVVNAGKGFGTVACSN